MKIWVAIIIAAIVLLFFGAVLISTNQTSDLPTPSENISETIPEKSESATSPVIPSIGDQGKPIDANQHLTLEEFRALAQQVSKSLPTKRDLRKLSPEDIHLTPSPILVAGERLGQIAQAVYNEPSLGEEAMAFYLDCANAAIYPDSVRALCYSNYKALAAKLNKPLPQGLVPNAIRQLADKLQGI